MGALKVWNQSARQWQYAGSGLSNESLVERRAQSMLTGGGTISVDANYNISWSNRFITISTGRYSTINPSGYFDLTMPAVGTVIPGVGGAANVTVTSSGIALPAWYALYYILPIGSANTSIDANWRIAAYTADYDAPANWIMVAIRNVNTASVHFANGVVLPPGMSGSEGPPNTYLFNMSTSTSQTIGAGTNNVRTGWSSANYGGENNNGWTNVGAGAFACPIPGVYLLSGVVTVNGQPAANSDKFGLSVIIGSSSQTPTSTGSVGNVAFSNATALANRATGLTWCFAQRLNKGDWMQIQMQSLGPDSLTTVTSPDANTMTAAFIGV